MKIFLLLLAIIVASQAQVLGIDFGTQFWKASLISPGKNLVIVENSRSGRKSINGISFHDGVRHFQDDALYKRLKKPQFSYFYLNKLMRSLDFEKPLQGYDFENGTYYITHNQDRISLEQLVGMILKNIKLHATQQAGSEIKDAVLAIPANWGWKSKMALINAASIADLSILALANENSAAAIYFAITRNDTQPVNIGFFNLGSQNLQFSVIQFFGVVDQARGKNIESLRVLSHIVQEDVGGLYVDKAIANYLAEQFMKKNQIDPRTKEKSYTKLLHKAADVKQILSANKQTQVYIQGLISGIDLNLPVKRQIIENIEVFKTLHRHLDQGLEKAGITRDQLHSVEMIGGASRIPLISKIVKQHFDHIQVGAHINGDQAMAFGSSLRAANLSITFRVKQLHFYDGFDEDIRCVISDIQSGVLSQQTLFTKDSQHGSKFQLLITPPQQDIKISLFYGDQLFKEYVTENITSWSQKYNQTAYNFTHDPNVKLSFTLSTTNIADLKEAYVNITMNHTEVKDIQEQIDEDIPEEELEVLLEEQRKRIEADKLKIQEERKKKEQQQAAKKTEENTQEDEDQAKEKQPEDVPQIKQEQIKRTRKVTVNKTIEQYRIQNVKHSIKSEQVLNIYPRYTKEEVQQNKKILKIFEKHENQLKEKSKVRNDLESTLYRLKDHYEDEVVVAFGTTQEIDNLKKVVSDKLQWMEQNAWTAETKDFEDQYNQVFKAYEPIHNRSTEYRERDKAANQTIQSLSWTYQKTLDLNKTHSWSEEKIQEHLTKINATAEETIKKMKQQRDRPLNQDPIFYSYDIVKQAEQLRNQYYLIKMIPRPKIKPKVIEQPKDQEQQKEQTNNKQTENGQTDNGQDNEKEQQESSQQPQENGGNSNQEEILKTEEEDEL